MSTTDDPQPGTFAPTSSQRDDLDTMEDPPPQREEAPEAPIISLEERRAAAPPAIEVEEPAALEELPPPLDGMELSATSWQELHIPDGKARTAIEALTLIARHASQKALEPDERIQRSPLIVNGSPVVQPDVIPWAHIASLIGYMVGWCQRPGAKGWGPKEDLFWGLGIQAAHVRWAFDELARAVREPAQRELAACLHRVPVLSREKAAPVMVMWGHLVMSAKAHVLAVPQPMMMERLGQQMLVIKIGQIAQPITEAQAVKWQMEKQQVAQLREMLIYELSLLAQGLTGIRLPGAPGAAPAPQGAGRGASS